MTWCAHHVFVPPTDKVLNLLLDDPVLSKGIYWVRDISDHNWYHSETKHSLPPNGLLIVRPVCAPKSRCAEWYECVEPIISWSAIEEPSRVSLEITPNELKEDSPKPQITEYPPASFLKHLKRLSTDAQTTVAFYHCFMWGGDVEVEYSWVFSPEEVAYLDIWTREPIWKLIEYHPGSTRIQREASVLVKTLSHFGLNLPTRYFALHTRSFPWDKYKMGIDKKDEAI